MVPKIKLILNKLAKKKWFQTSLKSTNHLIIKSQIRNNLQSFGTFFLLTNTIIQLCGKIVKLLLLLSTDSGKKRRIKWNNWWR